MKDGAAFRVGTFFVLGMVVLAAIFEMLAGRTTFLRGYDLHALFASSAQLQQGDEVRLAGVVVGEVASIRLGSEGVWVVLRIRHDVTVRSDTVASIRMRGLLGQNYVYLTLGSLESAALGDGGQIKTAPSLDLADALSEIGAVARSLGDIAGTVGGSDGVLGRASHLLAEDGSLSRTLANAEAISSDLRDGKGILGLLLADESLGRRVGETLTNAADIAAGLRAGQGTLGKLLTDDRLYDQAERAFGEVAGMRETLIDGEGTIGLLLREDSVYRKSEEVLDNLNAILGRVARGEGALGRIIHDEELYANVKQTLSSVQQATEGAQDQGPLTVLGLLMGQIF